MKMNDEEKQFFDCAVRPFIIYSILVAIIVVIGSKFGDMSTDTVNGYIYSMILAMLVNYINMHIMDLQDSMKNNKTIMTKKKANSIANEFFKDMNPSFWDGNGYKPSNFSEKIWEHPLNDEMRLEIVFVNDDDDGWCYYCDLVDTKTDESIYMLVGYQIYSASILATTIMNLCEIYEKNKKG